MKILWFDTETGGLVAGKNPILTIAGIIEMNNSPVEEFYFKVKPFPGQVIDDYALKVNGLTREEIATFEEPKAVLGKINAILGKYCNKFDKNDKFVPAGHNVIKFDIPMLESFYRGCGDKFLYSWLDYHSLDTVVLASTLKTLKCFNTPNLKLETLANHFQIPLQAHNALNDIRATRELFYKLKQYVKDPMTI